MSENWQPADAWPTPHGTMSQGPGSPAPRHDTNGLAIAALILGIVWLAGLGALLAVILGVIALRQIKRRGESGRGLAGAGLTLGIVGIVLPAVLVAVGVVIGSQSPPVATQGLGLTPSASPTAVALPSCSPAPCADYQGFVLGVASVQRDFHPGPGGVDTPGSGFHIVRVTISFSDVTGEHGYNSGFDLSLIDASGTSQSNLNTVCGQGCPTFLPGAQDMAPGGHAGPFTVCYPAGGPVGGVLTLEWTPDISMTGCEQRPTGISAKRTGVLIQTDGCNAVLISLG